MPAVAKNHGLKRPVSLALLVLLITSGAPEFAHAVPCSSALGALSRPLNERDRDALRSVLQMRFNEADLLVQNQRSDRSDLQRQEREAAYLRVFERIPRTEALDALKTELGVSAELHELDLIRFELLERTGVVRPLPEVLFTDQPRFEPTDDQLVQVLRFRVTARGDRKQVERWVRQWGNDLVRLVEPEPGFGRARITSVAGKKGWWQVSARAFRFREIEFPRLVARDPLEFLPAWACRDPRTFAQSEPLLWRWVERAREAIPRARPLYEERRKFLLLRAQFDFFIKKALASESHAEGHHPTTASGG